MAKSEPTRPIRISPNTLPLLEALYLFENHTAPSMRALALKAVALRKEKGEDYRFGNLVKTIPRLSPQWIIIEKSSTGFAIRMNQAAIDLIEGRLQSQQNRHR